MYLSLVRTKKCFVCLQEKLQVLRGSPLDDATRAGTRGTASSHIPYPAEAPADNNLLDASYVEPHLSSGHADAHNLLDASHADSHLSSGHSASLDESIFMDSQDMLLADILCEMDDKVSQQSGVEGEVDDDSILGSQLLEEGEEGLEGQVDDMIGDGLEGQVDDMIGEGLVGEVHDMFGEGLQEEVDDMLAEGLDGQVDHMLEEGLEVDSDSAESLRMSALDGGLDSSSDEEVRAPVTPKRHRKGSYRPLDVKFEKSPKSRVPVHSPSACDVLRARVSRSPVGLNNSPSACAVLRAGVSRSPVGLNKSPSAREVLRAGVLRSPVGDHCETPVEPSK